MSKRVHIVDPTVDLEECSANIRRLLAEQRTQAPFERAAMREARRERDKAIRSRDAHRARIRELLAQLPPDRREVAIAELGIDLESWSQEPATPTRRSSVPVLPPVPPGQCVYFVQGVDGGPIKIGTSRDVEDRVRTLQCASPVRLRVVGVVAGGAHLEATLHQRLAKHRLHGEWFAAVPEVLAAIAEVVQ